MSNTRFLRTCLVTGKRLPPEQLKRFTIKDGELTFDIPPDKEGCKGVKNPGRGGYVTNDTKIIAKLPKLTGKIRHYLRVKGEIIIEI